MRRKIVGVQLVVVEHHAEPGPDGGLRLSPEARHGVRTLELYEGLPAGQLYLGGSLGSISLGGIRGKNALLFIDCRDSFTPAEQYDLAHPSAHEVRAATVAVPLGGHRDIIVDWDRKAWHYRLTCTKL
jgi:hypothetical protein